ncbi:MAG: retroviral-like aspartic protease family protein [Chloroflexi bacterium]|nr:retroviral-like aspartic protease family protein [Chloroflexota bacterium]
MGTFTHDITLISRSGDIRQRVEALVDTGATFTSVPASLLERLGVEPERTVRLQLANGQIQERPIGPVRAELNGIQGTIVCVFGEAGEPSVIGAVTLEIFLLSVDPVERRLVPVVGYRLERETL